KIKLIAAQALSRCIFKGKTGLGLCVNSEYPGRGVIAVIIGAHQQFYLVISRGAIAFNRTGIESVRSVTKFPQPQQTAGRYARSIVQDKMIAGEAVGIIIR